MVSTGTTAASRPELLGTIERIASRAHGDVSLSARLLRPSAASGAEDGVAIAESVPVPTASAIKVPIMITALTLAERRALDLDRPVTVRPEERAPGSGVLTLCDAEVRITLRDLIHLMIGVSDNTATNRVIREVGGSDAVNACLAELGLPATILRGGVTPAVLKEDPLLLGESTTADMSALMRMIAMETAISPAVSRAAEAVLRRQQRLGQSRRYLVNPADPTMAGESSPLVLANKTGTLAGIRMDVGLVRFPSGNGFTYAVSYSHGVDPTALAQESEGDIVCGLVVRELVRAWWSSEESGPAPVLPTPYARLYGLPEETDGQA